MCRRSITTAAPGRAQHVVHRTALRSNSGPRIFRIGSMDLVRPALPYLASYSEALQRGWSQDNVRGIAATREELERIARDPVEFVESLTDPEGKGRPITLPDGSVVP